MHCLPDAVARLLRHQDAVVARRQLLALGHTADDVRRWRRQRLLVPWHDGVYLGHTGIPTWQQRAWAAVLLAEPAGLYGASALRAISGPGMRGHDDSGPIHVAVDHARTVRPPPGVRVHRVRGLDTRTSWNASPPRMRVDEAVVDVAAAARDDHAAVRALATAVGSRLTTAARLRDAVAGRRRLARRAFLLGVLDDVAAGVCSVLEREYLRRVERAHGLPRGRRQSAGSSRGRVYRDVVYDEFNTYVELDGRLDHSSAEDIDADLERDLDAAVERQHTIRAGWGQAVGRPCRTAQAVGRLLQARGWTGQPTRCPDCP